MQVTSLLLLATTAIVTAQSQDLECFNGQLRESNATFVEYCYDGEWRRICSTNNRQWDTDMSVAACTELGYSDSEITTIRTVCHENPLKVFILSDCKEPGLNNCTVNSSDICTTPCSVGSLRTCNTASCADGALRLVGGLTDREGRVEVCVGGRWRTVCTGSQELAGAVCSQMGYTLEGSTVAVTNSFPPGAFPEYRLNCTQLSNTWHCSPVEQQCVSFVELGIVCRSNEDIYNECSICNTLSPLCTNMGETNFPTTLGTTDNERDTTSSTRAGNSTTLIAGICVLVALLLAVSVGWIVSCVILLKRRPTQHKQSVDPAISTRSNQSYTQQHISDQLYDEAEAPDQTYSRLNRGQAQDHKMDDIATYDYADPNQIKVDRFQETNPPPVSGEAIVREEEFYITEDHTYAAVNKKAKKKKKKENGEGDKNDSSL